MAECTECITLANTTVYIILGLLILGFLFFVGNTIRCYLNKPRYIDDDD